MALTLSRPTWPVHATEARNHWRDNSLKYLAWPGEIKADPVGWADGDWIILEQVQRGAEVIDMYEVARLVREKQQGSTQERLEKLYPDFGSW